LVIVQISAENHALFKIDRFDPMVPHHPNSVQANLPGVLEINSSRFVITPLM
jgi:hypothetical protein